MRLLTIDEAADRLAVSAIGVRCLVHAGRLEVVRPLGGRAIRVVEESLEHYVKKLRGQNGDVAVAG